MSKIVETNVKNVYTKSESRFFKSFGELLTQINILQDLVGVEYKPDVELIKKYIEYSMQSVRKIQIPDAVGKFFYITQVDFKLNKLPTIETNDVIPENILGDLSNFNFNNIPKKINRNLNFDFDKYYLDLAKFNRILYSLDSVKTQTILASMKSLVSYCVNVNMSSNIYIDDINNANQPIIPNDTYFNTYASFYTEIRTGTANIKLNYDLNKFSKNNDIYQLRRLLLSSFNLIEHYTKVEDVFKNIQELSANDMILKKLDNLIEKYNIDLSYYSMFKNQNSISLSDNISKYITIINLVSTIKNKFSSAIYYGCNIYAFVQIMRMKAYYSTVTGSNLKDAYLNVINQYNNIDWAKNYLDQSAAYSRYSKNLINSIDYLIEYTSNYKMSEIPDDFTDYIYILDSIRIILIFLSELPEIIDSVKSVSPSSPIVMALRSYIEKSTYLNTEFYEFKDKLEKSSVGEFIENDIDIDVDDIYYVVNGLLQDLHLNLETIKSDTFNSSIRKLLNILSKFKNYNTNVFELFNSFSIEGSIKLISQMEVLEKMNNIFDEMNDVIHNISLLNSNNTNTWDAINSNHFILLEALELLNTKSGISNQHLELVEYILSMKELTYFNLENDIREVDYIITNHDIKNITLDINKVVINSINKIKKMVFNDYGIILSNISITNELLDRIIAESKAAKNSIIYLEAQKLKEIFNVREDTLNLTEINYKSEDLKRLRLITNDINISISESQNYTELELLDHTKQTDMYNEVFSPMYKIIEYLQTDKYPQVLIFKENELIDTLKFNYRIVNDLGYLDLTELTIMLKEVQTTYAGLYNYLKSANIKMNEMPAIICEMAASEDFTKQPNSEYNYKLNGNFDIYSAMQIINKLNKLYIQLNNQLRVTNMITANSKNILLDLVAIKDFSRYFKTSESNTNNEIVKIDPISEYSRYMMQTYLNYIANSTNSAWTDPTILWDYEELGIKLKIEMQNFLKDLGLNLGNGMKQSRTEMSEYNDDIKAHTLTDSGNRQNLESNVDKLIPINKAIASKVMAEFNTFPGIRYNAPVLPGGSEFIYGLEKSERELIVSEIYDPINDKTTEVTTYKEPSVVNKYGMHPDTFFPYFYKRDENYYGIRILSDISKVLSKTYGVSKIKSEGLGYIDSDQNHTLFISQSSMQMSKLIDEEFFIQYKGIKNTNPKAIGVGIITPGLGMFKYVSPSNKTYYPIINRLNQYMGLGRIIEFTDDSVNIAFLHADGSEFNKYLNILSFTNKIVDSSFSHKGELKDAKIFKAVLGTQNPELISRGYTFYAFAGYHYLIDFPQDKEPIICKTKPFIEVSDAFIGVSSGSGCEWENSARGNVYRYYDPVHGAMIGPFGLNVKTINRHTSYDDLFATIDNYYKPDTNYMYSEVNPNMYNIHKTFDFGINNAHKSIHIKLYYLVHDKPLISYPYYKSLNFIDEYDGSGWNYSDLNNINSLTYYQGRHSKILGPFGKYKPYAFSHTDYAVAGFGENEIRTVLNTPSYSYKANRLVRLMISVGLQYKFIERNELQIPYKFKSLILLYLHHNHELTYSEHYNAIVENYGNGYIDANLIDNSTNDRIRDLTISVYTKTDENGNIPIGFGYKTPYTVDIESFYIRNITMEYVDDSSTLVFRANNNMLPRGNLIKETEINKMSRFSPDYFYLIEGTYNLDSYGKLKIDAKFNNDYNDMYNASFSIKRLDMDLVSRSMQHEGKDYVVNDYPNLDLGNPYNILSNYDSIGLNAIGKFSNHKFNNQIIEMPSDGTMLLIKEWNISNFADDKRYPCKIEMTVIIEDYLNHYLLENIFDDKNFLKDVFIYMNREIVRVNVINSYKLGKYLIIKIRCVNQSEGKYLSLGLGWIKNNLAQTSILLSNIKIYTEESCEVNDANAYFYKHLLEWKLDYPLPDNIASHTTPTNRPKYNPYLTSQYVDEIELPERYIIEDNTVEFQTGTEYIFNHYHRFNGWEYFENAADALANSQHAEVNTWSYVPEEDTFRQNSNTSHYNGFISPYKYDTYNIDLELASTDGDDDLIGVCIAFERVGTDMYMFCINIDRNGIWSPWTLGASLQIHKFTPTNYTPVETYTIQTYALPIFSGGWKASGRIKIWIERANNNVDVWISPWEIHDPNYANVKMFKFNTVNLNTIPYSNIFANKKSSYGFTNVSQRYASYYNINIDVEYDGMTENAIITNDDRLVLARKNDVLLDDKAIMDNINEIVIYPMSPDYSDRGVPTIEAVMSDEYDPKITNIEDSYLFADWVTPKFTFDSAYGVFLEGIPGNYTVENETLIEIDEELKRFNRYRFYNNELPYTQLGKFGRTVKTSELYNQFLVDAVTRIDSDFKLPVNGEQAVFKTYKFPFFKNNSLKVQFIITYYDDWAESDRINIYVNDQLYRKVTRSTLSDIKHFTNDGICYQQSIILTGVNTDPFGNIKIGFGIEAEQSIIYTSFTIAKFTWKALNDIEIEPTNAEILENITFDKIKDGNEHIIMLSNKKIVSAKKVRSLFYPSETPMFFAMQSEYSEQWYLITPNMLHDDDATKQLLLSKYSEAELSQFYAKQNNVAFKYDGSNYKDLELYPVIGSFIGESKLFRINKTKPIYTSPGSFNEFNIVIDEDGNEVAYMDPNGYDIIFETEFTVSHEISNCISNNDDIYLIPYIEKE